MRFSRIKICQSLQVEKITKNIAVKNLRLIVFVIIELFLIIISWVIFNSLGKLNIALSEISVGGDAAYYVRALFPLISLAVLVPFVGILFCIFWELHLAAVAKKQRQEKVEQTMSELLFTSEEESEEQKEERERRNREKYDQLRKDLHLCFDEQIGKKNKLTHKQLSEKVLSCISSFYEITQGEIFIRQSDDKDDKLVLSATYAFYVPEEKVFEFSIGEGLIGQVAKAGTPLYLDNIPDGYITVKSGLGSATPTNLLICPWKDKENNVYAVLELAAFKIFTLEDIELFEGLASKLKDLYSEKNQ
jgi:hypothetical protein